jgi:quercetin dioxygenase-like cupin family protein
VIRSLTVAAGAVGLAASVALAYEHKRPPDAKGTVITAASLKWVDNPALKGAQIAVLAGDPQTGAYSALKKLAAGTNMGKHTHTFEQKTVMVSGTIILQTGSDPAQEMTPGSYLVMPAGVVHSASCKAGADCVYYEEQPGPADFQPVEEAKK